MDGQVRQSGSAATPESELASRRPRARSVTSTDLMYWWAIAILGISSSVLVLGGFEMAGRGPIVLVFLFVCPGMAWSRLLSFADPLVEWTLAVAFSLAIDAIVAASMLYGGVWNPGLGLVLIVVISLLGVILHVVQSLNDDGGDGLAAENPARGVTGLSR